MPTRPNNHTPDLLGLVKSVMLIAGVALLSLAGIILCFSHRIFGAPSNLAFTAGGFFAVVGAIWIVQECHAVRDKILGIYPVPGAKATVSNERTAPVLSPNPPTQAQTRVVAEEPAGDRKWQTQIASDMAPKMSHETRQPRLAIPRTRQAPARIGGEWEEE